jgi:hypothetical protein
VVLEIDPESTTTTTPTTVTLTLTLPLDVVLDIDRESRALHLFGELANEPCKWYGGVRLERLEPKP